MWIRSNIDEYLRHFGLYFGLAVVCNVTRHSQPVANTTHREPQSERTYGPKVTTVLVTCPGLSNRSSGAQTYTQGSSVDRKLKKTRVLRDWQKLVSRLKTTRLICFRCFIGGRRPLFGSCFHVAFTMKFCRCSLTVGQIISSG
jgi:hypothetical protein